MRTVGLDIERKEDRMYPWLRKSRQAQRRKLWPALALTYGAAFSSMADSSEDDVVLLTSPDPLHPPAKGPFYHVFPRSAAASPISAMPTEILCRIFDATCDYSEHQEGVPLFYESWTILALVCKRWKDPALERFWKEVHLDTLRQMEDLVFNERTSTYNTTSLAITAEHCAGWMERAMRKLYGIRHLMIEGSRGVSPYILCLPSLASLENLTIDAMECYSRGSSFLPLIPFRLKRLAIGPSFESLSILYALLTASKSTLLAITLVPSTRLVMKDRISQASFDEMLDPPRFSVLERVDFCHFLSDLVVHAFFPSPALRSVGYDAERSRTGRKTLPGLLLQVPGCVENLNLSGLRDRKAAVAVIESINGRLDAAPWPDFKRLRVEFYEKNFKTAAGAPKLLKRLGKMGVEITFVRGEEESDEEDETDGSEGEDEGSETGSSSDGSDPNWDGANYGPIRGG
ncbi:hypothetical protein P7C70_g4320, partial [Phenoliferia sp. Uapishka_3]